MKKVVIGALILSSFMSSGCAVYMAANQPGKKDMKVLAAGMPRDAVISELGAPISSEMDNGKRVNIFKFTQGYSDGNKAIRAVGHGVADVFTLGLWEVVGTPAEATINGKEVAVKVIYDQANKVDQVVYLKEK